MSLINTVWRMKKRVTDKELLKCLKIINEEIDRRQANDINNSLGRDL